MHLLLGVGSECLRKVVLLSVDINNDFALQFASQGISFSQISCLVQDCYWPFGRNRSNVRLSRDWSLCRLTTEIEKNLG